MSGGVVLGKLPCHGDFVERGVTAGDRLVLDAWLAASMTTARSQFGARFDKAFDSAPAWQFAWHDEHWTAGALTPSVDASGRRFPLLVALGGLQDDKVGSAAKFCEDAAACAISKLWSADALVEAIEASDVTSGAPCPEAWWNEKLGDGARLDDRLPADIVSHMLAAMAIQ